MEILYFFLGVQFIFGVYQSVKLRNLKKSLGKAHNKCVSIIKKNDVRLHELYLSFETFSKTRVLPPHLKNIPLADDLGMILSVKEVDIPNVIAPYNAALMQEDDGYLLFFRYDTPLSGGHDERYRSHIGCTRLNGSFEKTEEAFTEIETGSCHSEDARVFEHEGRCYLLFNDLISENGKKRGMRIASFHKEKRQLGDVVSLDLGSEPIEKNWTPFSYKGGIHFLYTIGHQDVFKFSDPTRSQVQPVASSPSSSLEWTRMWGPLRGGTPAQLVDGEFLAFFHSAFEDAKGIKWYVMGAYTFEAALPFRMKRISPYPILFRHIYETELLHTAHPGVRSLYPVGFACEKKDGKELIHVSCGENDSRVKIITDRKSVV